MLPWLAVLAVAFLFRWGTAASTFVGGEVRFATGDAYLHARRVLLTVESSPRVASSDNYIKFPDRMAYAWAPLRDFAIASLANLGGLGRPDEHLTLVVAAVFPVVAGRAGNGRLSTVGAFHHGRQCRPPRGCRLLRRCGAGDSCLAVRQAAR